MSGQKGNSNFLLLSSNKGQKYGAANIKIRCAVAVYLIVIKNRCLRVMLCYLTELFFFLLMIVMPIAAPPLTNNKVIHQPILLLSPVCGLVPVAEPAFVAMIPY